MKTTEKKLVIAAILSHYRLTVGFERKITIGYLSDNFILKGSGTRYFLKKYRPANRAIVPQLNSIESVFSKAGAPVIMPLLTTEGTSHFQVGSELYSLYPYVDGIGFNHNRKPPRDAVIVNLATLLAEMHTAFLRTPKKFLGIHNSEWEIGPVYNKQVLQLNTIDQLLGVINRKHKLSAFDKLAKQSLLLKQRLNPTIQKYVTKKALGPCVLTHGDFHTENVFIDRKGKVTHIFDFEKSGLQPKSLEVARAVKIICFSSGFKKANFDAATLFLKTYRSVLPVPQAQLHAAFTLIYHSSVFSTWIETEHYLKHNTRTDALLQNNYDRLLYLSRHMEQLLEKLDFTS